jgi:molybdenum cofactor sulfurtransferase
MVERVRRRVLDFFRADPNHFDVIFVANATAAIKLVGYSFQDHASERGKFWYGYHSDAHTSLVGLRELARSGYHCFRSDNEVEKWLDGTMMDLTEEENENEKLTSLPAYEVAASLPMQQPSHKRPQQNATVELLAYPAQSNMNGHRPPKHWPLRVRQLAQRTGHEIFTLLDAAAFVSSAPLDLSDVEAAPDFTALSFYKIFGMPDLGALIVRKSSSDILTSRRYFGGGTVDMVIAYSGWHARKSENVHEVLEDGTVPFHSLIMLDSALSVHESLFSSMATISKHVTQLSEELYTGLSQLRHASGRSVCHIYKAEGSSYGDSATQGPTVAFNVRRGNGAWIPVEHFEALANACNIHIRTGGVCNPGGVAEHLQLQPWEMRKNFFEGFRCGQPFKVRGGKLTGIIRVSLGAMSNRADIRTFVLFVEMFFVDADDHDPYTPATPQTTRDLWTVQGIQISPIRHGPAWQVPSDQDWEVESRRLAFHGEWCLVDLEEKKMITDPTLTMQLLPELRLQAGALRLSGNRKLGFRTTATLEISLWDLPTGDWVVDTLEIPTKSTRRIARIYPSEEMSTFLSSILGRPCTLARYFEFGDNDVLPVSLRHDCRENQDVTEDGITIQFHPSWKDGKRDSQKSNILLSSSQDQLPPLVRYIQVGSQGFISVGSERSQEASLPTDLATIRVERLPDAEESIVSQNAVIQVSDTANLQPNFSPSRGSEDSAVYLFCPVSGCGEKRSSYEQLTEHAKMHAEEFFGLSSSKRTWKRRLFPCYYYH